MIFQSIYIISENPFSKFILKSATENVGCTWCSALAGIGSWGPRVNRTHPLARPRRGGADWRNLADGEVSGQTKVSQMTTLTPRTRSCTCGGQWSSGDRSPPCMAERRRGWSLAGHSWPRDGHRKGARAPRSRGEQDALKESRESRADRRSPRSGNLW
jgi:hypothetical protein